MAVTPVVAKEPRLFASTPVEQEFSVLMRPLRTREQPVPVHRHLLFEIALVRHGECEIIYPNNRRLLQRRCAFFIPSGLPHGFTCSSSQGIQFVVVQFRSLDNILATSLANTPPVGLFRLSEAESNRFIEIGRSLQQEISGARPYATLKAQSLKLELIVMLLRAKDGGGISHPRKEQRELIETALSWMHKHFHDESMSIEDVAKRVALSPSYFRMLFNQVVGSSPKRYLTQLRLQTSKSLMLQGEYTIANIASYSGFHSPQQFSKLFRQYTGMSPSEWRAAQLISCD